MKYYLKILFAIFYLILVGQVKRTFASHAAGAEISYVCLGSGNYEITYMLYRDCYGILPNTSMDFQITNDCGIPAQTVFLSQLGMEVDVINVCPTSVTTCHGGPYTGIQKYTYRGIVNLSAECTWYIGHGEPARNAAITTITGGGSDILFVSCMINNRSGICNNSPLFTEDPILSYCVGQILLVEPPVNDNENDSLSFELITPRTGPNLFDTVTFLAGYSKSQPFLCNSPMTFNPVTGIFRGIPSTTDISIYALMINEFRNGVLIGQVVRDITLTAENCNNIIPFFTGINGFPNFTIDVIANQQNCFFISAIDPNSTNQTTIEYDYSIPGMTFSSSGGQVDTGYFCWTPTLADTLQNPYCIRVKVTDGNCPMLGICGRNFYLNVQTAVGVDDIVQSDLAIWPNPFTSEINLSSSLTGKVEIKLFDIQGRQVMNSIVTDSNSSIILNNLEEGIYLISITSMNSGQTYWNRLLKN